MKYSGNIRVKDWIDNILTRVASVWYNGSRGQRRQLAEIGGLDMVVDNKLVTMLDLLAVTPVVDSIKLNADTRYEVDIAWNPHMDGGRYEYYNREEDQYYECSTAQEVIHNTNPMFMRVMDWVPSDCGLDAEGTVDQIAEELWSNGYHWNTITDEIICNCAKMLGICD